MSNNNILLFESKSSSFKFIAIPIWIDYLFLNNGEVKKKQLTLIGLKNTNLNVHVIHPLSQFIMHYWGSRKYNTQRKYSNNIVKFLNYLLENQGQFQIESLQDLKIVHGDKYLNSLTVEGVRRDTVRNAERTLVYFYKWLVKEECSIHFDTNKFEKKQGQYGYYYESPFRPIYPEKKPNKVEHAFPPSYIPLFLEVAIAVAKPIALGIYLQFFGGLRISEVINLRRTQVTRSMNKGDFVFKVDNQHFRTDIKDHASVKKVRTQRVFQIEDWGNILLNDHLKIFKPIDQTNALFVNQDGKAMSQRSYRQYFEKAKHKFIELLISHGDSEQKLLGQHLKYMKWSTHIGRGTFTNLLAEYAENPYEISQPRGDSSINSSLTYMNSTERLHKKIEEKFSNLHEHYIPKLIDREGVHE
ncbi:tyrosine-type recombinase/integrase [Bacillus sp. FJAT-45350]|uniref:tyrosine-type recombinase/integrase n=1 Tax=Bacillus sp. FJAT-45350 TaxID=2011014 RepID=UPI00211BA450|nr:site-specific integrase [Bacillus sp. FJAT-45350]